MIETAALTTLVFLGIGFALSAVLVFLRASSLNRAYSEAARRLGFEARTSLVSFPSIAVRAHGFEGSVSGRFAGTYGAGATRLSAKPESASPLFMHVTGRTAVGTIKGLILPGRIATRDAQFDSAYQVRGSDEEACLSLLDADARAAVADLGLSFQAGVRVSVCPGHITVETPALLDSAEEIETFAGKALSIASRLASGLANLGGIAFAPSGNEGPPEAPRCQVCGGEVAGEAVECRKCRTPVHGECWDFAGGCPAFGCGSRKRAKRAG